MEWKWSSTNWWRLGDLPAQAIMAWAAIAATALTLVGIFLLWRTLHYTRKAAIEAGKATIAANKTIEVTREIGIAQTVAYPAVDEFSFELGERNGDPYRPIINTQWRNAGNTPAFDFGINCILTITAPGKADFVKEYPFNSERGLVRIDPGTAEPFHAAPDDIAFSSYLDEMRAGTLSVCIEVVGSYRDAFKNAIPVREHFRSSAIYCHPDRGEPGGESFQIKMAKYDPDRA